MGGRKGGRGKGEEEGRGRGRGRERGGQGERAGRQEGQRGKTEEGRGEKIEGTGRRQRGGRSPHQRVSAHVRVRASAKAENVVGKKLCFSTLVDHPMCLVEKGTHLYQTCSLCFRVGKWVHFSKPEDSRVLMEEIKRGSFEGGGISHVG